MLQKDVGGIGGKSPTEGLNERAELLSKSLLCVAASRSQQIYRVQLQRVEKRLSETRMSYHKSTELSNKSTTHCINRKYRQNYYLAVLSKMKQTRHCRIMKMTW